MKQTEFEQLVRQYEKLVYTICYQFTLNHHTAQDLAQETFLAAWRHRSSVPADNPKAWLARIAANKAKDHLKSAQNLYSQLGTPSRRVFFRCFSLKGLGIHTVFLRPFASISEKIPRQSGIPRL